MEKRTALVLRHKKTGLYYDKMNGHGKELWQARRFMNEEQLAVWSEASIYRPDDPDEYEPVVVEMSIQEVMK
ncbi:hypothetical protein L1N85_10875 [Paenibacillus alkaliterrae]|uniref:hypothetical protein n=1 Tax=Paenibacillus alkaliterrae TaxID=320909 RepID=UPI001F415D91|nr:hypothetical protein [Paenibacillus alkaliterrae]MCF2938939.1 hypothetical protein [Paenibacillus alkaliterrae]